MLFKKIYLEQIHDTTMYHGFTLQPCFWYGVTNKGVKVATSGWTCEGHCYIYFLEDNKWVGHWIELSTENFNEEFLNFIEMREQIEVWEEVYNEDLFAE